MTNWIWITTQFQGYHYYPAAPKEVEFLKNEHRHIFKVKVWLEVFHDDREVEFLMFKNDVEQEIATWSASLGAHSCEMIADDIYNDVISKYPKRKVKIEVSEDGENGCEKEYY